MKKLMIALAFAGFGTVASNAQVSIEAPSKYTVATNSFWSNWYIQLGVDMTVQNPYGSRFFGDGENDFHAGRTYGVDLAIGKWFTPGLGLRLKGNWENGAFYRAFRNYDHVTLTPDGAKGGYAAIYGDVQFNLSNLFCGYNESRVWNLIAYPRAGLVRDFSVPASETFSPVLGVGVENTWRLGKRVGLYLDVAYNFLANGSGGSALSTDGYVAVDFGVQFNLGKANFDKAVTLDQYNALAAASDAALARLRADLDREKAINADLRAQLAKWANHKCEGRNIDGGYVASAATSVFFDINSSKLNSKKDIINLEAIAATAKASGAKVVVTGYADSKTGSDAYNQQLSEARAQAVADELVELGVNRDNIEVVGKGGVADVEPYNLNRRAVVELK